jgi:hypothetical protein
MRGVTGLLGLVVVLVIGLFVYRSYFTGGAGGVGGVTMGTNNPRAAADIVGVKADLNSMAQAERAFMALNGRYASLEELRSSGNLLVDFSRGRQGYTYSAEVSERHFTVTATYSGPATGMPTLSVDESMQITQH